jgi:hypothetical protein
MLGGGAHPWIPSTRTPPYSMYLSNGKATVHFALPAIFLYLGAIYFFSAVISL